MKPLRPWMLGAALAGVVAVALVASGGIGVIAGKSRPVHKTPTTYATPVAPSAAASSECGAWSATSGTVGAYMSAKYGEVRNCAQVGSDWIITTLGNSTHGGVVALDVCTGSDATTCTDGQNNHPVSAWKILTPPYPGGVTILSRNAQEETVIVDDGGHQLTLDLATGTFSK